MELTVADFGVGNLHSIAKALERAGAEARIASRADRLLRAEALVLPGVASFGPVTRRLRPIRTELHARLGAGLPTLGICIGLQALFERSEEAEGRGLGFIPGAVERLRGPRVPHMGWNTVEFTPDPLFAGVAPETHFYFAHSYAGRPPPSAMIGRTRTGEYSFCSALRRGGTYGVQFHPEKSASAGLRVLENFVRFAEEAGR